MVDAITAVSASNPTSPVRVENSLSIDSEPDNKWTAARQSRIDADQVVLRSSVEASSGDDSWFSDEPEDVPIPLFEGHDRGPPSQAKAHRQPEEAADAHLSGESERIGTTNFDDETPFGHRVAIV